MSSTRPSSDRARRQAQGGFTLVELMIGVLIGLFASLAVTQVLVSFEGQKRSTISGSDAQVNGALALDAVSRAVQWAGYGFGANPGALGCRINRNNGSVTSDLTAAINVANVEAGMVPAGTSAFPQFLVPLMISAGSNDGPDAISVLASGKRNFALPLRIISPGSSATSVPLATTMGVEGPVNNTSGTQISSGDLLVAVIDGNINCDLFQVTATPTASAAARGATSAWNTVAFANTYVDGNYAVNLGAPVHRVYSVNTTTGSLLMNSLTVAPSNGAPTYTGAQEIFPSVVSIKANYGKDTDGNGSVDTWDNVTPTTNAVWRQVIAVRVAVVTRSGQYEKDIVTTACPTWAGGSIRPATTSSDTRNCAALAASATDEDWKHYRYKVFETVMPLRNLLWNG